MKAQTAGVNRFTGIYSERRTVSLKHVESLGAEQKLITF